MGRSRSVELRYAISLIEKNLGRRAKIRRLPNQLGDAPVTCANITKSERMLGYRPKIEVEEGIERFVEWYRRTK